MSSVAEELPVEELPPVAEVEECPKFDFSEAFQTKVAAMVVRDSIFNKRTESILRPEFFENLAEAALVNIALKYFEKYRKSPDIPSFVTLVKDAIAAKTIRKDMVDDTRIVIRRLIEEDIGDRDFVIDKVAEFARHQAVSAAILKSVDLLDRGDFSAIEVSMQKALDVGAKGTETFYSYFDTIEARSQERREIIAGTRKPTGITTGVKALDDRLMHRGWGRRELTSLLGGAKVGKSTALINFAKSAALANYNVLYVTLELSPLIISERLDACLSGHLMDELAKNLNDVQDKVDALKGRAGKLNIVEFPTGSMRNSDLRHILDSHLADGTRYDLIVVDYADIMAPEKRSGDAIQDSKSVYEGLRAIMMDYDAAGLTATQTNRDGFKSSVAKAEHAAEDFNKVRIVDLMISINRTEEEMAKNEARLYFAASRNQKGGFTLRIQQDLERMRFLIKVLGIE